MMKQAMGKQPLRQTTDDVSRSRNLKQIGLHHLQREIRSSDMQLKSRLVFPTCTPESVPVEKHIGCLPAERTRGCLAPPEWCSYPCILPSIRFPKVDGLRPYFYIAVG